MKTISVREMKAHWSEVEAQVREGETFEVVNRGKPTVHILPAKPRQILKWADHLATAVKGQGHLAEQVVREDRDGRW
ncbi:MAG: type II toxin-antitoxin system Phd/YefM family antitoxin [Opitutales bacterium]